MNQWSVNLILKVGPGDRSGKIAPGPPVPVNYKAVSGSSPVLCGHLMSFSSLTSTTWWSPG